MFVLVCRKPVLADFRLYLFSTARIAPATIDVDCLCFYTVSNSSQHLLFLGLLLLFLVVQDVSVAIRIVGCFLVESLANCFWAQDTIWGTIETLTQSVSVTADGCPFGHFAVFHNSFGQEK